MRKLVRTSLAVGGSTALIVGAAFASTAATAAPPGPAAVTAAWAKVSASGAILASQGITGVNKFGGGRYNVFTSTNISNCALHGTLNTQGGSDPGPGSSSVLVGVVNSNTLFVRTATPSSPSPFSVDEDRPFSLLITCF
jgi:hypothetical protein